MSKLVNIGSLCIDLVYTVPAIAAAGETIASSERQIFAGGKGLNQSLAAARAGITVNHYGAVGADDGDSLMAILADEGVIIDGILQLPGPSGHAVIQVDAEGRNAIVISGGANRLLPPEYIDRALGDLQPGDWVLLQNEINDVDQVMRKANDMGASVAFNVAPPDARIHSYPIEQLSMLVVNEHEAMALSGESEVGMAFTELCRRCAQAHVVLTRGKHGLLFRDSTLQRAYEMDAFEVSAVDETAAGDAFVGYLMAGLVSGLPMEESLRRASAAGALAVTAPGAAPSVPHGAAVDAMLAAQSVLAMRETLTQ